MHNSTYYYLISFKQYICYVEASLNDSRSLSITERTNSLKTSRLTNLDCPDERHFEAHQTFPTTLSVVLSLFLYMRRTSRKMRLRTNPSTKASSHCKDDVDYDDVWRSILFARTEVNSLRATSLLWNYCAQSLSNTWRTRCRSSDTERRCARRVSAITQHVTTALKGGMERKRRRKGVI